MQKVAGITSPDISSSPDGAKIEYREHLPLTIRQVFYRLVGAYSEIR